MQPTQTHVETAATDAASGLTRRDAYRARVDTIAAVYVLAPETGTPGWRSVWLRDLSASGAAVEGPTLDAAEGDDVLVRFTPDGDGSFQLRGRIVRCQRATARDTYGVRFVNLTTRQAERLHALVARLALARRARRN